MPERKMRGVGKKAATPKCGAWRERGEGNPDKKFSVFYPLCLPSLPVPIGVHFDIPQKNNRVHGCQRSLTTIDRFPNMLSAILQKN
jgi:hypothetical protein